MDSDLKVVCIYQQKQSYYESAVYWRELDWRREQYQFPEVRSTKWFWDHVVLHNLEAPIHEILRKFIMVKARHCYKALQDSCGSGHGVPPGSDET